MYSDSFYNNSIGRVIIRSKEGEEFVSSGSSPVEFVINGNGPGSNLGEHMWISGDGQSLQSIGWKPFFSHVIVGVSLRSTRDNLDHVNFYKLIETSDGVLELFDFGINVIQT